MQHDALLGDETPYTTVGSTSLPHSLQWGHGFTTKEIAETVRPLQTLWLLITAILTYLMGVITSYLHNYPPPPHTPLTKQLLVEEEIDKMLVAEISWPSFSHYAAPIRLAPKRDGSTHISVNYQKLNATRKKDAYPLRLIQDIFYQMEGVHYVLNARYVVFLLANGSPPPYY